MSDEKLFKKKAAEKKRTKRYPILLTEAEDAQIQKLALLRNLSVAEYFRRCALGRRADIQYDTEVILQLRGNTQAIRNLYWKLMEQGNLPADEMKALVIQATKAIDESTNAMLRISK